LAEAPLLSEEDKTDLDRFMDKFMSDKEEASPIHKSLFDTI